MSDGLGLMRYLALASALLVIVSGCGGSGGGAGTGSAGGEGPPQCKESGIRYAGKTATGVAVCFTLSPDARTWREVSYLYVKERGCPGQGQGIYMPNAGHGSGPGRFTSDSFAARIRGERASGSIADENFCNGRRFAWSARAARPLTAEARRNLDSTPKSVCTRPGIRYVGTAALGTVVVCITLNSYRSSVVESGWSFGRARGCGGDVEGESTEVPDKFDLKADGKFDNGLGLTGRVRGNSASGLLTDSDTCPSRTFRWVARRTP